MIKRLNKLSILFLIFTCHFSFTQTLYINEIDSDNPGIDNKEFVELKSNTPNFDLTGYVLVFFNGASSSNKSYLSIDLDGYETDSNGLFLIGSSSVSPYPQLIIEDNSIQNGADGIAIYLSNSSEFPNGTYASQTNLIDAIVYGTNDANATQLMSLLDEAIQINEGESNNSNSIQRNSDNTYRVDNPTPRQNNDGSVNNLIGIQTMTNEAVYQESDNFNITFSTTENVNEPLQLHFTLNNNSFNENDYSSVLIATIPTGSNSTQVEVVVTDDIIDEGDEIMLIKIESNVPSNYMILNNEIEIRIEDNDYQSQSWGTPLNPTFGLVESSQPENYYDSLNGLSSNALKQALQNIIANPNVVRAQTYADVNDILLEADQNPENSNEVWLVYTEQPRSKIDIQNSSYNVGKWNREHTYPRSRGGFYDVPGDATSNGRDVFWQTNADSLRHGNSDVHALRAADGQENSFRNNKFYGEYNGPPGNLGSFKGDVARSVLYMAIRYNGLSVVNGYPNIVGQFGDLETILDWHRNDPPDDFEMNRNNVVYTWQYNRNPFIDHPDLVEYIWGNQVGNNWNETLSVNNSAFYDVKIFPNPASDVIYLNGISQETTAELYSIDGKKVLKETISQNHKLNINFSKGVYILKLTSRLSSYSQKIIIH